MNLRANNAVRENSTIIERIDRLSHIQPQHLTAFQQPPVSVKVGATVQCNLQCAHCNNPNVIRHTPVKDRNMPIDLYKRVVEESARFGIKEFAPFFYGEPFIDKRIAELVRIASRAGFELVFLTTNGVSANPETVASCILAGLGSLKFSVNASSPEGFASLTKAKPILFHRMLENIREAKKVRDHLYERTGKWCELSASFITYSEQHRKIMEDFLAECVDPYVDRHYRLPLYTAAGSRIEVEEKNRWAITAGNTGRADNPAPPLPCYAIMRSAHVDHLGRVYACCFYTEDDRFAMGSLANESFSEIWNNERFQTLRQAHLEKDLRDTPCAQCVLYRS